VPTALLDAFDLAYRLHDKLFDGVKDLAGRLV
jgi:hypothetical protein